MAIIWQKDIKGSNYQVRSAGKSLRLYTDGVFHTQYNPNHLLSGGIWDLLALPSLLYPEDSIKRVLVLGVGGGAVVHLLKALIEPEQIVGVELNPVHVKLMKRFFGIKSKDIELHTADAVEFIQNYQGEKFDLIIDDLFCEQDGEPHRVKVMDAKWMKALRRCMTRKGLLVTNFCDDKEFKQAAKQDVKWESILSLTIPTYENTVGVFLRRECLMMDIEGRLNRLAVMDKRLSLSRARFDLGLYR